MFFAEELVTGWFTEAKEGNQEKNCYLDLGPVVQEVVTVSNGWITIQLISDNKMYRSIHRKEIYPAFSVIYFADNRGQKNNIQLEIYS